MEKANQNWGTRSRELVIVRYKSTPPPRAPFLPFLLSVPGISISVSVYWHIPAPLFPFLLSSNFFLSSVWCFIFIFFFFFFFFFSFSFLMKGKQKILDMHFRSLPVCVKRRVAFPCVTVAMTRAVPERVWCVDLKKKKNFFF